jgi:hypothetical protein
MIMKTAENPVGNDSKNLSPLGQNLLQLAKINPSQFTRMVNNQCFIFALRYDRMVNYF